MTAQSLVARRIGTLPFTTVASPEYLRRFGVPQHPRELEEGGHHMVNFFSPRTGRRFTDDVEEDGESIALASNYRIAVNESNAYLAAALAGLGVTQMVTFMAAPHLASGALVPVLPGWKTPPIPVHVVYPPNRHLSAKVRSFVDWTAELFSQHAGTGSRAI